MVIAWLTLIFSGVGTLFYYNEWIYLQPTPIPPNHKPISLGKTVKLGGHLNNKPGRPIFLHFFNPDCPCSRFNIGQFSGLVAKFGGRMLFVVIVQPQKAYTASEITRKFNITVPVIFDSKIAAACGVYSTPQAVIINEKDQLYYRGNYNISRYCTDEKTSYAKIAIERLLNVNRLTELNPLAVKAYGCSLPDCSQ